jgi:GxxExxY protein
MNKDPYRDEGYAVMGAAFEVHRELGGGMAEELYQQSLEIELGLRSIPFESKPPQKVTYKEHPLEKVYYPDLVCYGVIMVELKAVGSLLPEHEGQVFNYMRISRIPVAYLINFGPIEKLEWKRFVLLERQERKFC